MFGWKNLSTFEVESSGEHLTSMTKRNHNNQAQTLTRQFKGLIKAIR